MLKGNCNLRIVLHHYRKCGMFEAMHREYCVFMVGYWSFTGVG